MSTPAPGPGIEPLTPERRREQTRRHLLAAAAQVFTEKGFHGATMDEVAAAAGFTKGAVYSNFKNKEDLFLALLDEHIAREFESVEKAMVERRDIPADEPTGGDIALTTDLIFGNPEFHLLSLEFTLYAARNEDVRRKLAERQRTAARKLVEIVEGELAKLDSGPSISAEDLATIYLSLFNGIGLRHLIDPETVDEGIVETAINFLTGALAREERPHRR